MSFGSRVVNTTDLMDIRAEMGRFCPRATINRERHDSAKPGDEIPDLSNAADADLRALSVNGWFDHGPMPALRLTVGVDLPSQLAFLDNVSAIPDPELVRTGQRRIASDLLRLGHRTLSRQNKLDLLRAVSLLSLLGLVVWLGIVIWPNIPAILVSVLAVWAFQRSVLNHLLEKSSTVPFAMDTITMLSCDISRARNSGSPVGSGKSASRPPPSRPL